MNFHQMIYLIFLAFDVLIHVMMIVLLLFSYLPLILFLAFRNQNTKYFVLFQDLIWMHNNVYHLYVVQFFLLFIFPIFFLMLIIIYFFHSFLFYKPLLINN